jgi:cytochrome c oxidase subunit 3
MSDHAVEEHWGTSPWPFLMSIGILLMLPLAFAFYLVYDKPLLAVLCLGLGVPVVVLSIGGWLKEALAETESRLAASAMPFFIVAEAFIFVAFFAAYWVTRLGAASWPPAGTPAEMPVLVPVIMTITLVASSVTIHFAEMELEGGNKDTFCKWLIITILLGTAFFCMSAYEWNHLFGGGFDFKTNIYSTSFYSITGFHASHVLVGIGIFITILIPALAGRVSTTLVKSGGVYWHFVDIIWFFVVSQVYFW